MIAGASPVTARADLGLGQNRRLGLGGGGPAGGSGRLYRWKRGEQGKMRCESMGGCSLFPEKPIGFLQNSRRGHLLSLYLLSDLRAERVIFYKNKGGFTA